MTKTRVAMAVLITSALMSGCAASVADRGSAAAPQVSPGAASSSLQARTAPLIGCSMSEVMITDVKVQEKTGTYRARCKEKTYTCGGDALFQTVTCTEGK